VALHTSQHVWSQRSAKTRTRASLWMGSLTHEVLRDRTVSARALENIDLLELAQYCIVVLCCNDLWLRIRCRELHARASSSSRGGGGGGGTAGGAGGRCTTARWTNIWVCE
jgi:hypothetical protein